MRQWRILHSESSRGWGGQEIRVFAELEWMRAQGHWVALAAHPASKIAARAQDAGITFYPLQTAKVLLPLAVTRMAFWLKKHRVEIVNTHSSNDGWLVGMAARLAGTILIRSRHIEVDYPNRFFSRLSFGALPHHVLTTSQRIADRLSAELGVPRQRVTCVATGTDLNKFDPHFPSTLRNELGLAPDVPLVGMISVLRSWKGHATFLDAAALLMKSKGESLRFIIAGDGPGRQELTDKIAAEPWQGRVTLLGHRTDVANILAALDVLVLPSFAHEGIPQIILQAQAMQRAVVATRIGGIPEVVTDRVTGLLVEPRDAAELARKIEQILDDAELHRRLGTAGRQNVQDKYSLDGMGQRLLALYQTLKGT